MKRCCRVRLAREYLEEPGQTAFHHYFRSGQKRYHDLGILFAIPAGTINRGRLEEHKQATGRHCLQRLFSTFPGGWPGIGLLLLRAAVGITLVVQGAAYLVAWHNYRSGAWMIGLLAVASGASLLIGFLTPIAGTLVGLSTLCSTLSLFPAPTPDLFDTRLSFLFVIVVAAAIVLTGPGAFSLDARLFGRREIIIPPLYACRDLDGLAIRKRDCSALKNELYL